MVAVASNEKVGFVKISDGRHGEMLGAHIVGTHATELIHEYVLFRTMEGIDEEIYHTIIRTQLWEKFIRAVMAADNRHRIFSCREETARHEIVMPQMGESITNGTITKWTKSVGDEIEIDEIYLKSLLTK